MIIKHLQEAERRLPNSVDLDLARAIVASVGGFMVDMLTCDALYFPLTRLTFWILVGVGMVLWQRTQGCRGGETRDAFV